jgi:DNA repair protein RecN (Recombination protein N)
MLTHLRITDFALLDDVEIDFGAGFNVLTGETGAGKSLLVEAVALLRGGRASADVVRTGADEARIEAVFEPPHGPAAEALKERLGRAGIDPAEEGLVVRRVIGKGRVYINSVLSTAAALSDVAGVLIELAGQHEHQTLGNPAQHLAILDAYGNHEKLLAEMAAAYAEVTAAAAQLKSASLDERARAEREEFLRFQLKELEEAELDPERDGELKVTRERLRAADKLLTAARRGEDALYAREGAIVEELGAVAHELLDLGKIDPQLGTLGKQIDEARVLLDDAAGELRRYAEGLDADPERLSQIEERLHLLERLLRKHRGEVADVAGLVARRDAIRNELAGLVGHEERRAQAAALLEKGRQRAAAAAEALTHARKKAAKTLAQKVEAQLAELEMKGARLRVELSATKEGEDPALVVDGKRLSQAGWDRAEFQLAANAGEEARPLHRIASGGELSRILLALKRVLSRADQVATYVFDEVDAGIGGAVADAVGRQIKAVAADKQVVCITHLAQIAAYADAHYLVEKVTEKGRVRTQVRKLSAAERKEEIARMIGGKVTPKARAHAEEMLKAART